MDEKTAELRDIFIDTTGADTVTERQESGRGSIADRTDVSDETLATSVEAMRDRFDFQSSLSTDALVTVLRGFFTGESDEALAAALDVDPVDVFAARMDLHLVTDDDHTPVDDVVRPLAKDDVSVDEVLTVVDADAVLVRRAYRVAEAELAALRANYRFRDEFADLLSDDDLSTQFASDARRDGLQDATEDLETDVSL